MLELARVGGEGADALGQLLGGHGILVHHPAERALVEPQGLVVRGLGAGGGQLSGDVALGGTQLFQEAGADGEQVTARELEDLPGVAEAGAHDLGLVPELLVVLEDPRDRENAGVLGRGVALLAGGLLVPVEDAAHEGRDQLHLGVGAGDGLGEGEQQRQVAADAVLAEQARGLDALPGGGDLDQDPVAVDAGGLVERDEMPGLGDGGVGVEAEARVDLGGDATGDDLEDLAAEGHREAVQGGVDIAAVLPHPVERPVHQVGVLGHGRRLQQQARVGRRVARLEGLDALEVASIGDDEGVSLES